MGIELLRIDERLIHGQILLGWAEEMDCTSIMIVDDATVSDPVMKSIMEMSFPENYKCSICSVSQVEKENTQDQHGEYDIQDGEKEVCTMGISVPGGDRKAGPYLGTCRNVLSGVA